MAMEISQKKWKLGFSNGERERIRTVAARDWNDLLAVIELPKQKLNGVKDCQLVSCYEAGRDGFWIHRATSGGECTWVSTTKESQRPCSFSVSFF
jgi:transposase